MMRSAFVLLLTAVLTAQPAWACRFHSYIPEPTLVDRLMMSEDAVLARTSATNPDQFVTLTHLRGNAPPESLTLTASADTKAALASDPQAAMLLMREEAYGPWEQIKVMDAVDLALLEDIRALLPAWEWGDGTERARFFAGHLDHERAEIRDLALLELDLVSYDRLQIAVSETDPALLSRQFGVNETSPIRVLLAGLSGDMQIAQSLQDGIKTHLPTGAPVLGAFATAWMELSGPEAAQIITEDILSDPTLNSAAQDLLVQALALQSSSGTAATRNALRAGLGSAIQNDPALAVTVAQQFGLRWDWSLQADMATLLQSGRLTRMDDILMIAQYVNLAREDAQAGN